ncbi:uncharacterized protein LOC128108646 isoform X4 [Peromyscus californicus insignis]|uniref:uncharacterized protein LOC128108646 isoform X4 n=1 Tax=Peromyscus californicus insignis TaxID=564181 RepID=UPI0022A6A54E|nr:uncharacterized protein LOC128108646 isoform X4 [Peromyscus californicus insignis]
MHSFQSYVYHTLFIDGITYLCATDNGLDSMAPSAFLKKVSDIFTRNPLMSQEHFFPSNALATDFQQILAQHMAAGHKERENKKPDEELKSTALRAFLPSSQIRRHSSFCPWTRSEVPVPKTARHSLPPNWTLAVSCDRLHSVEDVGSNRGCALQQQQGRRQEAAVLKKSPIPVGCIGLSLLRVFVFLFCETRTG